MFDESDLVTRLEKLRARYLAEGRPSDADCVAKAMAEARGEQLADKAPSTSSGG
jgi:hypothetical protein